MNLNYPQSTKIDTIGLSNERMAENKSKFIVSRDVSFFTVQNIVTITSPQEGHQLEQTIEVLNFLSTLKDLYD